MINIINVFIVLTPFQKREMENIFPEKITSKTTLIIKSKIVNGFNKNHNVITLNFENFSIFNLLENPFKQVIQVRKYFANLNEIINDLESKYLLKNGFNLFIGSDKDHFTQLFINKHIGFKNKNRLIAIEEGTGYYIRENVLDYIYSFIYPIFSFLIYGNKINYIRCLGKDKRIDDLYLRFPDLVPNKSSKILYKKIPNDNFKINLKTKRSDVLFFSFPEQDYNQNFVFKKKLYTYIIKNYLNPNELLFIKPHPRENLLDLKKLVEETSKIRLIDKNILGEDLKFEKYKKIVNFSSSIIFHLFNINFPMNDIITIGFKKRPNISIFNSTVYLKYSSIIN